VLRVLHLVVVDVDVRCGGVSRGARAVQAVAGAGVEVLRAAAVVVVVVAGGGAAAVGVVGVVVWVDVVGHFSEGRCGWGGVRMGIG